MKRVFSALSLFYLLTISLNAKVYLGAPFNDGMVLQRESKVALWGKATPGSTVTIMGSWNYKTLSVKADDEGKWKILLPTPKSSFSSYSITLNDGTSPVVVRDVLIGEVWFASGQSNMEMPVVGWDKCPVTNSAQLVTAAAKYTGKLHFTTIPNVTSRELQDSVSAQWQNCTSESIKKFSVVAYTFATSLIDKLQCPVGIINCNWGGSNVEAWIPLDILRGYGTFDLSDSAFKKMDQHTPAVLYNAMVNPLKGYTMKGFIWYQGESNVGNGKHTYAKWFTDMITRWRADWGQGNLPFYYVEIAPYKYGDSNKPSAALLREQQFKAKTMIKNLGMVSIIDLVTDKEEGQIHPANKQPVGQRLANWALANDYKTPNINFKHPEYKSMDIKNGRAYLSFTNIPNGYNRQDGITGFEVCGADSVFHPAKAIVKEKKVMLVCPKVTTPVAVRYCFKNFQLGNLANKEGLPLIPFRTDNFDIKK